MNFNNNSTNLNYPIGNSSSNKLGPLINKHPLYVVKKQTNTLSTSSGCPCSAVAGLLSADFEYGESWSKFKSRSFKSSGEELSSSRSCNGDNFIRVRVLVGESERGGAMIILFIPAPLRRQHCYHHHGTAEMHAHGTARQTVARAHTQPPA